MSKRVTSESGNAVSLFPFLAVLLCTMGALLVLLVVLAQRAGERVADASAPAVTHATHVTAEQVAEHEAKVAEAQELQRKLDEVQTRQQKLAELRKQADERLLKEQERLAHLEDHNRRLEHELARLSLAHEQLKSTEQNQSVDQERAEKELARLKKLIEDNEADLEKLREEQSEGKKSYAILPYKGPNGTYRKPIYIECTSEAIILHPEGTRLAIQNFEVATWPGNPLAAALRATRKHLITEAAKVGAPEPPDPYPLILVRPDGTRNYQLARAAIKSWDSDFGYEFINSDWKLSFPESADPQLAKIQQHAIALSGDQLARLIRSAPTRFRNLAATNTTKSNGSRGNGSRGGYGAGATASGSGDQWASGNGTGQPGQSQPGQANSGDSSFSNETGGNGLARSTGINASPVGDRYSANGGSGNGGSGNGSSYGAQVGGNPYGELAIGGEATGQAGNATTGNLANGKSVKGHQNAGSEYGSANGRLGDRYAQATGSSGNGEATVPGSSGSGSNTLAGGPGATGSSGSPGGGAKGSTSGGAAASGSAAGSAASGGSRQVGSSGTRAVSAVGGGASIADSRGRNWAVQNGGQGAVPIQRPIQVVVRKNRIALLPSRHALSGTAATGQEIALNQPIQQISQQFVDALRTRIDEWGFAGSGLYWRPVLKLNVSPDAGQSAAQVVRLLENSGVEVSLPNTAQAGGASNVSR